jgi:hypothetical protein
MVRQLTLIETGTVSEKCKKYKKEKEKKKIKDSDTFVVGEYVKIIGGTKGTIGEVVYTTKLTKKSIHVVDTKGEIFLKRKVHLLKMEGMQF